VVGWKSTASIAMEAPTERPVIDEQPRNVRRAGGKIRHSQPIARSNPSPREPHDETVASEPPVQSAQTRKRIFELSRRRVRPIHQLGRVSLKLPLAHRGY
jgi:hypothetical protein